MQKIALLRKEEQNMVGKIVKIECEKLMLMHAQEVKRKHNHGGKPKYHGRYLTALCRTYVKLTGMEMPPTN
jgi:hypothetical protein